MGIDSGGTLNVNQGSTFTLGGTMNIGSGGTINVNQGSTCTLSGSMTISSGGTVNLNTLFNNNGVVISPLSGSLKYVGDVTVGTGGLLGTDLTLSSNDHKLTLGGTLTVDAGHTLTLSNTLLSVGSLISNGTFLFQSGTLTITADGGSVTGPIASDVAATINVNANNVSLGSIASLNGFNHQGVLNINANTVTLNSAGYAKLGVLTTSSGGTINAPNGVTLDSGSNFSGSGMINAKVAAATGSVIQATGNLTLGSCCLAGWLSQRWRTARWHGHGHDQRQHPIPTWYAGHFGQRRTPGTLNVANGALVDFDQAITGTGTINSTNALAQAIINNGLIAGNSSSQPISLKGYVKGLGHFKM